MGESWFITRRTLSFRHMSLANHAKIFATVTVKVCWGLGCLGAWVLKGDLFMRGGLGTPDSSVWCSRSVLCGRVPLGCPGTQCLEP